MTVSPLWRRISVAAVQGVLLWWLYASAAAGAWPRTAPGLFVALVTAVVLVPLLYYLTSGLTPVRTRHLAVLACALVVLLGVGWHQGTMVIGTAEPTPDHGNPAPYAYALVVGLLCLHALPFAQSWLVRGDWRWRYPDLFRFAWRNALLAALGVLFFGVFWLLLGLWAQLFSMIGVRLFANIFFDARFAIPASAVALGVGVQLAGSVERLETALREQILTLLKWLSPLAVLILAIFSVALLVKAPELLAARQRTISASWLLWLIAMNVLLLNAAYQDGSANEPFPRWLGRTVRFLVPLLLVVAAIAAYAILVRIDEYGLTVSRAWAVLVALLATVYAAGYAWSAVRGGDWMSGMGRVNVLVALLTIASLTTMLTPALSPYRLTAASQHERVLARTDTPRSEDFHLLRFDAGTYGRKRLSQLADLEGHPREAEIRSLATAAQAASSRHLARAELKAIAPEGLALQAYPAGTEIEPALRESIAAANLPQLRGHRSVRRSRAALSDALCRRKRRRGDGGNRIHRRRSGRPDPPAHRRGLARRRVAAACRTMGD